VKQKQKETRSNKDNAVELSPLNSSFSGVLYVEESAREVSSSSTNNIPPLTTIYGIYQGSITSQPALGGISTLGDVVSHAEAGNIVRWMGSFFFIIYIALSIASINTMVLMQPLRLWSAAHALLIPLS
jgi:hypothetical protein